MLKVTTRIVMKELARRGVPVEVIAETPYALLRYFYKGRWQLLQSTLPETSSALGKLICDQKYLAMSLARLHNIPTPQTEVYTDLDNARAFMTKHAPMMVVKPADGAHGNGITVGIRTDKALQTALAFAQKTSPNGTVLLQQQVSGSDLRMLVIGGTFVAAARRIPAAVVGNGRRTLRQLIEYENATNPERGENDEKRFAKISLEAAERFLGARLDTGVPAPGKEVTVVGTANIGAGGRSVDYTDKVAPEIITAAETFARLTNITACGVDFIWEEDTGNYYFIEGNATPGFCLHIKPSEGASRPVDKHFVDALLAGRAMPAPVLSDKPPIGA